MTIGGLNAVLPAKVSSIVMAVRLLECGRNAIGEVPTARWDVDALPALTEPVASRPLWPPASTASRALEGAAWSTARHGNFSPSMATANNSAALITRRLAAYARPILGRRIGSRPRTMATNFALATTPPML